MCVVFTPYHMNNFPAESDKECEFIATISGASSSPLIIQFPWPRSFHDSIRKSDPSRVTLDKIRLGPWSHEFMSRSKWDMDRLEQ